MRGCRRRVLGLSAVVALLSAPVSATSYSEAGTSGAQLLTSRFGARPAGMGNAYVAVSDDINAMTINPAGLGTLDSVEVGLMQRDLYEGITQRHLGFIFPLGEATSANVSDFGAFGIGLAQVDYGNFIGRDVNGLARGSFEADDRLLLISYGKPVGRGLYLGGNFKRFREEIAGESARGNAFDAGVIYKARRDRLALGVALNNMGSGVSIGSEEAELPQTLSGGVAIRPVGRNLVLAFDLVKPRDDYARVRLGGEWWASGVVAFRAGYDSSFDAGHGFSAGLGVKIDEFEVGFFPIDRVMIDYAMVPTEDLSTFHHFSLSLRFWGR